MENKQVQEIRAYFILKGEEYITEGYAIHCIIEEAMKVFNIDHIDAFSIATNLVDDEKVFIRPHRSFAEAMAESQLQHNIAMENLKNRMKVELERIKHEQNADRLRSCTIISCFEG